MDPTGEEETGPIEWDGQPSDRGSKGRRWSLIGSDADAVWERWHHDRLSHFSRRLSVVGELRRRRSTLVEVPAVLVTVRETSNAPSLA